MSLLKITNDNVSFPPTLEFVPEFQAVLKDKKAKEYILYIHNFCDYESPYATIPELQRQNQLNKELLDGKSPPKVLKAAIVRYNELFETDAVKLIKSARKAVFTLREYFENADPNREEDPGRSARDLMTNLKSVGELMKKLSEWEEAVKKDKDSSEVRKGVQINEFNEG